LLKTPSPPPPATPELAFIYVPNPFGCSIPNRLDVSVPAPPPRTEYGPNLVIPPLVPLAFAVVAPVPPAPIVTVIDEPRVTDDEVNSINSPPLPPAPPAIALAVPVAKVPDLPPPPAPNR
jgi:hypothetical protein